MRGLFAISFILSSVLFADPCRDAHQAVAEAEADVLYENHQISAPLADTVGERGLQGWATLSPELKARGLDRAFESQATRLRNPEAAGQLKARYEGSLEPDPRGLLATASAHDRILPGKEESYRRFSEELDQRIATGQDPMTLATWAQGRILYERYFESDNSLVASALVNAILQKNGLPPPTFPKTVVEGAIDLEELLDMSVKETIRLTLKFQEISDEEMAASFRGKPQLAGGPLIGAGRQGTVRKALLPGGGFASVKRANSVGSLASNRAEAEMTRFLLAHAGAEQLKFVPDLIDADPKGYWIAKGYIEGETGKEILAAGKPLTAQQKAQVRELYDFGIFLGVKYSVYLDLNSNNVVWNEARASWVIIDTCPWVMNRPTMNTFQTYLEAYWGGE